MKRFLLATLTMIILTALGSNPLLAVEKQGCSRKIVVTLAPTARQFALSRTGVATGVVPEFLAEVTQRTGCEFEFVSMPKARVNLMLKLGNTDIVPSIARTPERDRVAQFFQTGKIRPVLISLKKLPHPIRSLQNLIDNSIRFDVMIGNAFTPEFSAFLANKKVRPRIEKALDDKMLVEKLKAGRMDAVLIAAPYFAEVANKAGLVKQVRASVIEGLPPAEVGIYVTVSQMDPADAEKITRNIRKLLAEGLYSKLMKKMYRDVPWALMGYQLNGRTP